MGTVGLALEEYELMKDSKYRVYVSAVDKALKNFDYTSEWADLISALGKLNKVLLSHQKFPVIPRRIKISKRLAQCMHPALPSGVHLKALETYDIIFKCMGTNRLSQELFIYSAGLFPLLGHSAMNVRPSLLRIYETHFVPLGERLRPGLSGFLSGVLPGLEEGSDHFDRTNSLLDRVCEGVGPSHFYGCIWECLASNNAIRLPAISYILAHFNKKKSMEDQLHIMGTNIDVMVNALCTGVQDSSVLVQRSALDLLLIGFPMHNSQLVEGDMVRLVTAALVTILRRDMSLNRRLFAWLLGSEVNISLLSSEHPLVKRSKLNEEPGENVYFEHYSRKMLIQAIKTTLSQSANKPQHDLRPYKLLVSLLDKPDIGPVILDDILYEVFRALYADCDGRAEVKNGQKVSGSSYRGCQELLKSANLLFSTLEPYYIWQYAGGLFSGACARLVDDPKKEPLNKAVQPVGSGRPNLYEVCTLTEFLLETVSLETYLDTPSEHLPGLFLHIVTQLTDHCDALSANHIATSLKLSARILSRVQPIAQPEPPKPPADAPDKLPTTDQLEVTDRCRANSDLTEYKTEKAIKSKLKKSKTDSKIKKLNSSKNYALQAESSPILLSVVYNDTGGGRQNDNGDLRRESTHFSSFNLEQLPLENGKIGSHTSITVLAPQEEINVISIPIPTKQQTVLEECKRHYENFYVKLVGESQRIVNGDISELFNRLVNVLPIESDEERTSKLELLFSSCLEGKGWELVKSLRSPRDRVDDGNAWTGFDGVSVLAKVKEWEEPMKLASNLLVELSTFPSYCLPESEPVISNDLKAGPMPLPPWLRVLLVCACWLREAPSLQLIATSTLLDLVCLLRSQSTPKVGAGGQGVVAVVIVPLLKRWHLDVIERRMVVVEVLARSLWYHLGYSDPKLQVSCVELLYQLHQVVAGDCVENVIGESLINENPEIKMEAFQRFGTLWHLGRDLDPKTGCGRSVRGFDKSLLKMLDNLQLCESCPLKLQAQSWLLHSLLRGDVARILDPLLYMLLDPATARMSVLHVSVQHSNTVVTKTRENEDNDLTAKIYAISSEDGNVIYHVQDTYKSKLKRTNIPVRAKQIFAIKTLIGREKTHHLITEKNGISISNSSSRNMSVFVNPCASMTDVTEDDSKEYKVDFFRSVTRLSGRSSTSANSVSSVSDEKSVSDPVEPMVNEKGIKFEAAKKLGSGFESGYDFDSSDSNPGFELNNFKRWSNEDLELSTAADEFFNGDSSVGVVHAILNDILDLAITTSESRRDRSKQAMNLNSNFGVGFHPLHSHMLLYCGVYDSSKILYTLRTLRSVLLTNARMFLCAAATTGLANVRNSNGLISLLARHRKSVFGKSFHGDAASVSEFGLAYRSSMYLEVLISVSLYFARSFYPNLGQMRLTVEEIAGNRQVQLASAELLTLICAELILIVRDSGRGFSCYIADLLSRCKVQKVVLHCVFSSVYNMRTCQETTRKVFNTQRSFTEEIVSFNDPVGETAESVPSKCKYQGSEHSEGFQIQLLRLLLALIMLEHQVNAQKGDSNDTAKDTTQSSSSKKMESQLRYIPGTAIPQQPMFLASVLTALELRHTRHLHQHWTTLVTSALPFMGQSLTQVVLKVVTQLCYNIERLADGYVNTPQNSPKGEATSCCLPANYAVTQLEALTVLCHYCLLESTQAFNQQLMAGMGATPGANPGQIFNNLMHVFMPTPLNQSDKKGPSDFHLAARRSVLSNLPRIIASVSVLWHAVSATQDWELQNNVLGSPRVVKHQLLELLSPISLHHGVNFLAAVAVAWQERRPVVSSVSRKVIPVASSEQQVLVNLVGAIRVLPIDTLVQTVHQVVKQPPPIQGATKDLSLEVSTLELFYCYIQSGPQLVECWGSLQGLLRDGLTLTPPAQFLMLAILNEFIQKCPPLQDKKDHRDLQDITAKLVESCTQIAGACLEQTTWLRRNLAVREDDLSVTGTKIDGPMSSLAQYSVQAQGVLAELLAPLLDVSYGSQEKERVVALLTTLMGNITPYLKNHSRRNVQSYFACSQLLASLSSYQYTRKAWRRDVFDLLLDPSLFQIEATCLPYWRTILDNLMTHDTTTFRDLMARVNVSQSNSLSIFSSREAEHEQRAQLLKRLAFVILCSETDQYHKYMPEIQERLAENLRLPQVAPGIQAQVFLCFRVLLLRMSAQHVTSLWPTIISEMVQVFLQIEQELNTDSEQFSSHIRLMSGLDHSWVVNSNNGLHATGHPGWLQLQLATSKLLDLAVLLPAHQLPQFQMYRWAFVGDANTSSLKTNGIEDDMQRTSDFVPHVVRIARLMDSKYSEPPMRLTRTPGHLLLNTPSIKSLQELHPFFLALSSSTKQVLPAVLPEVEAVIERDFLEMLR